MPRIDARLIEKLKKKLKLSQSGVYARIDRKAQETSLSTHLAALLVARDANVNYRKFASEAELAMIRSGGGGSAHSPEPQVLTASSALPESAKGRRHSQQSRRKPVAVRSKKRTDTVFVVHGRDKKARQELSAFLRALHVDVIEWSKALVLTKKGSPYIGEVIDAGFDHAQAIIVLLTPDDEARLKKQFRQSSDPSSESELTGQPRQNVLFEAGMAFGRYKETTILIQIGKIRRMTDVDGVHVVHLTGSMSSRKQLIGKLKTVKVELDDSGEDWFDAGDFSGF